MKSSFANRGLGFEAMVQEANEYYNSRGIALVQKIPTPIRPVSVRNGIIHRAYFERKSTVDYIGVYRNVPIAFDAKEVDVAKKFYISTHIPDHQVRFLESFDLHGGLGFFLVSWKRQGQIFLLLNSQIIELLEAGKKAITLYFCEQNCSEVEPDELVRCGYIKNVEALCKWAQ